jgi:hypothetical protein
MMGRWAFLTVAVWLGGCASIRAAAPPVPGALEYREVQAEIWQRQTEIGISGSRIEESGRGIVEGLEAIETAMESPEFDRERVITQFREVRVIAEDHQSEIKSLNLMLAQEREFTRRRGEMFDRREEDWQRALSDREAENVGLRVENKAVKGQRNTLKAIVIPAVSVALLFAVFKILRFFKVLPF